MSSKDLAKVWQKLSIFLVLLATATWMITQGISPDFGIKIEQRRQIAALFGLFICIPLYWISLWIANRYSVLFGSTIWFSRIPPVGLDDELDFDKLEGRIYQRFVLTIFIIFPITAITHFFNIFFNSPVLNKSNHEIISMWSVNSPIILLGDDYRYGEGGGVTFFPFYEPLILTILFIGVWSYLIFYIIRLFKN